MESFGAAVSDRLDETVKSWMLPHSVRDIAPVTLRTPVVRIIVSYLGDVDWQLQSVQKILNVRNFLPRNARKSDDEKADRALSEYRTSPRVHGVTNSCRRIAYVVSGRPDLR